MELHREKVDLSKVAHESTEALREAFPQRKVSFRIADEVIVAGNAKLLSIMIDKTTTTPCSAYRNFISEPFPQKR